MPVSSAGVGRQPIVDRARETVGYELLFRALEASTSAFDPLDDDVPQEIRDTAADLDMDAARAFSWAMRMTAVLDQPVRH